MESDLYIQSMIRKLKRRIGHLFGKYRLIDSLSKIPDNFDVHNHVYDLGDEYRNIYVFYDPIAIIHYRAFIRDSLTVLRSDPTIIQDSIKRFSVIIQQWSKFKSVETDHMTCLDNDLNYALELSDTARACTHTFEYLETEKLDETNVSKSIKMTINSDRVSYERIFNVLIDLPKNEQMFSERTIQYRINAYGKMIPTLETCMQMLTRIYSYCGNTGEFYRYKMFAKRLMDMCAQYADCIEAYLDALHTMVKSLHTPIKIMIKTYY